MKKIISEIESVKQKYAPDKRVAIFNVSSNLAGESLQISGEVDNKEGLNELVERIKNFGYKIENKVNVLPDSALGAKIFGIVNLSVANIRSEPKHPAELATQAMLGTCVNVLKVENGWYLVQTPDKYISWVDDDGIVPVTEEEQKSWKNADRIIVRTDFSSVYSSASDKSQKLSDVVQGNILKFLDSKNEYSKVEFPDGRVGFIKSDHVENFKKWFENTFVTQENILNSANEFIGLPYLWGGTSLKGVDCSGFTK
ncbi:MAG: SH3 domain-containing protein, partial [Melioribacteraceae bacterium]|nr:SH3 domain-containing protein [Melioribacteraceae bacterium]